VSTNLPTVKVLESMKTALNTKGQMPLKSIHFERHHNTYRTPLHLFLILSFSVIMQRQMVGCQYSCSWV